MSSCLHCIWEYGSWHSRAAQLLNVPRVCSSGLRARAFLKPLQEVLISHHMQLVLPKEGKTQGDPFQIVNPCDSGLSGSCRVVLKTGLCAELHTGDRIFYHLHPKASTHIFPMLVPRNGSFLPSVQGSREPEMTHVAFVSLCSVSFKSVLVPVSLAAVQACKALGVSSLWAVLAGPSGE